MALFRNKNESLYPDGKKSMITIIKNECRPGDVLWRVPYEDFNDGSKVIVAENEEALFWKNGEIIATFTAGSYTLSKENSTDNFPFLTRIRSMSSNGVSAYNCKIIYINKSHKLDNTWGTDSPIQVRDNVFQIMTSLSARGAYTMQIEDGKKFFLKFAGSNESVMGIDSVASAMRAPVMQKIKSFIGRFVSQMQMEIVGICAHQDAMAEAMQPYLQDSFGEYGLRLVNFYIESLDIADDASRIKLEDARVRRATMAIDAEAELNYIRTFGISWGKLQTRDILMASATNENGVASSGAGIGMGMATMGAMINNGSSIMAPLDDGREHPPEEPPLPSHDRFSAPADSRKAGGAMFCPSCGKSIEAGAKFCSNCGSKLSSTCPGCGAQVSADAKFCSNCGRNLS